MAQTIETLAIKLEIDGGAVMAALQRVSNGLNQIAEGASTAVVPLNRFGTDATTALGQVRQGTLETGEAVTRMADVSSRGTLRASSGFVSFGRDVRRVMGMVRMAIYPVMGLLGGGRMWAAFSQGALAMDDLSTKARMNISDLDAWAKANQAAGGSSKAFTDALEKYVEKTGKSGESFIRLGEQTRGMTKEQLAAFSKMHGISKESLQIFQQSEQAASDLVASFKQTAFTAQDAENVRRFRTAWNTVKASLEGIGNVLMRSFLPGMTTASRAAASFSKFLHEHMTLVQVTMGLAGAALGVRFMNSAVAFLQSAGVIKKGGGIIGNTLSVLKKTLTLIFSPIGLVIAGIIALAFAIDDLITFAEGGESVFEDLLEEFGFSKEEIEALRKDFQQLGKAVGTLWNEYFKPFAKWLGGHLVEAFLFVMKIITGLVGFFAWLVADISNGAPEIKKLFADMWNSFTTWSGKALDEAWAKVVSWCKGLYKSFQDEYVTPVVEAIKGLWSGDLLKTATEWVAKVKENFVKEYIDPIMDALKRLFSWETVKDAVVGMWNGIIDAMPKPLQKLFGGMKVETSKPPEAAPTAVPPVTKNAEGVAASAAARGGVNQDVDVKSETVININGNADPNAVADAADKGVQAGFKAGVSDLCVAASSGVES